VSTSSDRTDQEPGARPVPQTGRPPVPRTVPSDTPAGRDDDAGQHHTQEVPFPLPPLPGPDVRSGAPGPVTGQLDLRDYPPRVPGGRRPGTHGADDPADGDPDEGAPA
jgi:hypothetical protein